MVAPAWAARLAATARHAVRPLHVVLTGGPGGGKTTLLPLVARELETHLHWGVVRVPEVATQIWTSGFQRTDLPLADPDAVRDAMVALAVAQHRTWQQIARLAMAAQGRPWCVLHDRGVFDEQPYYATAARHAGALAAHGLSVEAALAMADVVIHLDTRAVRSPQSYRAERSPVRAEDAEEALARDEATAQAWAGHPMRVRVPATDPATGELWTPSAHVLALLDLLSTHWTLVLRRETPGGDEPPAEQGPER